MFEIVVREGNLSSRGRYTVPWTLNWGLVGIEKKKKMKRNKMKKKYLPLLDLSTTPPHIVLKSPQRMI
jgi:hypothetical protein